MYPYRIRLRGPWEAEPLEPPGPIHRVTLPARFGECGLGECRRVLFRRRFGRPRSLDEHERIWLIGERVSGRAIIRLNGRLIGEIDNAAFQFPVTEVIGERNELAFELAGSGPDTGLWGDIALEIRCRAYLDNLATTIAENGDLRVNGRIAGEGDERMDVYVLAEDATIGYGTCRVGDSFDIATDRKPEKITPLRVELVNGAVVCYVAEIAGR